jgi:hypothetical protein
VTGAPTQAQQRRQPRLPRRPRQWALPATLSASTARIRVCFQYQVTAVYTVPNLQFEVFIKSVQICSYKNLFPMHPSTQASTCHDTELSQWMMWSASTAGGMAHGVAAEAPTHHSHDTSRDHSYHGAVPCQGPRPCEHAAHPSWCVLERRMKDRSQERMMQDRSSRIDRSCILRSILHPPQKMTSNCEENRHRTVGKTSNCGENADKDVSVLRARTRAEQRRLTLACAQGGMLFSQLPQMAARCTCTRWRKQS